MSPPPQVVLHANPLERFVMVALTDIAPQQRRAALERAS